MTFAFYFLSAMTLLSGIAVVRSRNIVHAGYWLLPCFVGIAGLFAALEAHFFFVVQLLIYAGAILVLMLFAVMLTRNVAHPERRRSNLLVIPAAVASLLTAGATCAILQTHSWNVTSAQAASPAEQTRMLGQSLIGIYAVPFEVASLILVAALIGSVVVAKSDPPSDLPELGLEEEPEEIQESEETFAGARS